MQIHGPPNESQTRTPTNELDVDYVDEEHIKAFQRALDDDDSIFQDPPDSRASSIRGSQVPGQPPSPVASNLRIRKVSALSDFAPINLKVRRRKRGRPHTNHRTQDWLFVLLRWPLLFFIFLFIWAEFSLYVIIRQLVNTKEWLLAWRGRKGVLRQRLRAARTYQEWKDAAATLDEYLEFNEWKKSDEDPYYDWKLIRKVKQSLKSLREANDVRGVLGVLETCIRTNFSGVESPRLYSETYIGTKDLIESYIDEQEKALEFIRHSSRMSNEEKKRFFKSANNNLGTSALCLSGGASFGYYHFGVVKAFLDEGLLPRVITGTSAGGLIAAMVCTRTDDELRKLLVPELANRITACEEPFIVWARRACKTGARFDAVMWARKCSFFTRGSMTFREAFARTGRILNISVIPADRHSPTKLLNYMTAPNTVIWSALLASAAVPGILNPVVLMHKLKDGSIVPWNWGTKFKDGSLRVDIPIQALNLYFNVTHPVVSQVNPHVHLFFFAPRGSAGKPVAHRKGKGWRGNFLLSAAEQWLKLELTKNFKVIRDLELLPPLLGQDWSSVFLQRFDGAVTIWPHARLWDWFRLLSDPDPPELERMIRVGQIVTWPKLHMIENRFRLEKQIFLGRLEVRRAMQQKGEARTRTRSPVPDPSADGEITETIAPISSAATPQSSAPLPGDDPGGEPPLSVDTDDESAFAQHSPKFFKRPHRHPASGSSTPYGSSTPRNRSMTPDALNSPLARHQCSSAPLQDESASGSGIRPTTPDLPPVGENSVAGPPSKHFHPVAATTGLFKRLRTKSLQTITSPFSTLGFGKKKSLQFGRGASVVEQQGWSSDSSSDDDLSVDGRLHMSYSAALRADLNPDDPDDEVTDMDG